MTEKCPTFNAKHSTPNSGGSSWAFSLLFWLARIFSGRGITAISALPQSDRGDTVRSQVNRCFAYRIILDTLVIALIVGSLAASQLVAAEPDYLVYVSNERSGDISIIDPVESKVIATVPVGKRPRGIHCSPDGTTVFIAVTGSPRMGPGVDHERPAYDTSADGIIAFDATKRAVLRKLPAGSDPEQFAILKDGRRAVISNEDKAGASVIDLTSGEVLGQVKVSEEPEGVAVDPANGQVYVTCEEKGEVYVIDPDRFFSPAHFGVGARPRSAAFLPDGSRAYVPAESGGTVSVIDTASNKVLSTIKLDGAPMCAVMSPDGKELYVTTGRAGSVAVIDTSSNQVVSYIPVGQRVWGLALSPDGSTIFAANGRSNDVSVVDVKTRKELSRVKVADGPWGVAIGKKP